MNGTTSFAAIVSAAVAALWLFLGVRSSLFVAGAAAFGALAVHSYAQLSAWILRRRAARDASSSQQGGVAPRGKRFRNYSVYVNGKKSGCSVISHLLIEQNAAFLTMRCLVPDGGNSEQSVLLRALSNQDTVHIVCAQVGGKVLNWREMLVESIEYEAECRVGQTTLVARLRASSAGEFFDAPFVSDITSVSSRSELAPQ